ncbi:MAG: S8 family serine peptidase, partial [Clostridia bacterium]|nr:S8 family serine peptidase [Clostridia bacterium]
MIKELKMAKSGFTVRILSVVLALSLVGAAFTSLSKTQASATAGGRDTTVSASAAKIEKLGANIRTDQEKFYNEDVVYQLPQELKDDDEISVIVSMNVDTLMDVYENHGGGDAFKEFVTTQAASAAESKVETKRRELISRLDKKGISYTLGEKYDTLLSGFEITVKAKYFDDVGGALGNDATLIIGDEYESAESKIVTNEVDVYPTGIFDSSSSLYQGDGVVVAILDTGLDYTHQAFDVSHFSMENPAFTLESVSESVGKTTAASFTPGLSGADVYMNVKIPYAYDYADKDADVLPINSEHGTHVAGIIAGSDDEITGVAPQAQLAIMKVFSDNRSGAKTSWLIAALEDCVTLGVDVINMSLGASGGFTREVDKEQVNVIYDKIKNAGISLIASAGNEANATRGSKKNGTNGLTRNPDTGTVGSPSTYDAPLSVASVDGEKTSYLTFNGRIIYFNEATNSEAKKKNFINEILDTVGGVDEYEFEFVTIPGIGQPTDYPNREEFYRGKIVLVKRGQTTFEEKIRTALLDKGAAGVIIYNNISGTISMAVGADVGAACSISQDDGEFLAAAKTGRLLISKKQQAGPFMSDFSSWGPTSDLKIKPEITGHGGEIKSSVPGGTYEKMSGTSMSAPNVAGATALIRQFVK